MTRKQPTPSYRAAYRFLGGLSTTALAITLAGCAEQTPTEMSVEIPLMAASVGHTGTVGRSFYGDMTQELTSTVIGDPDGVGTALITMNTGQGTVCWYLTASNIALTTGAHIHRAPAGLSGPVVIPLTAPGANGTSSGCAEGVSRELIVDIFTNTSQYYVNVHTVEHIPGAIRTQLE